MKNRYEVLLSLILFAFLIMSGCNVNEKPIVSIISLQDHPVLNTVRLSFEKELDTLLSKEEVKIQFLRSNAQGRIENLPDIIRQIFIQRPEIIVPISTPVTQALMREANSEQRIVYSFVTNPSDLGDELTRTNSTGVSDAINYGSNIELIRQIFGEDATIGMLYNPNEANSVHGVNTVKSIISSTGLRLVLSTVVRESDVATTLSQLARNVDVIYVGGDNTVVGAMPVVINAALIQKTPVIVSDEGSVELGALAGVSVDYNKLGKETARLVYKILSSDIQPRSIPRKILSGDKLLFNLSAAKQWGIEIPDSLLVNADTIIE